MTRSSDGVVGLTLDAGALIDIERRGSALRDLLVLANRRGWSIRVPAGALGQVWRGGGRQAALSRFLQTPAVSVVPLDEESARAAGEICGRAGTSDLIDASVVLCAREHGHAAVTSDPGDLGRLDPSLPLIVC